MQTDIILDDMFVMVMQNNPKLQIILKKVNI